MERENESATLKHAAQLARKLTKRLNDLKKELNINSEWDFFQQPGVITDGGRAIVAKIRATMAAREAVMANACNIPADELYPHQSTSVQLQREIASDMARLRFYISDEHVDLFLIMFGRPAQAVIPEPPQFLSQPGLFD